MVFKRSDGRWICKTKGADGKWRQKTFATEAEARKADAGEAERERAGSRLTLAEVVVKYVQSRNLSTSTKSQFAWIVSGSGEKSKNGKPEGYAQFLADRYADSLTRSDLEAFREKCRAGGCTPATVDVWESKLRAPLKWAASEELIAADPWGRFSRIKAPRGRRSDHADDFRRMFPFLRPWLQWAAKTAVLLALRPGKAELWDLNWSAVDFGRGVVSVYMPKVKATKTAYPPQDWLDEARVRFEAAGSDRDAPVCPKRDGTRLQSDVRYQWRTACRRAGVPYFSPYCLRHIAATEMLAAGADIAAVAAALGHSTPTTTLRAYAHAMPEAQKAAMAKLDGVWKEKG